MVKRFLCILALVATALAAPLGPARAATEDPLSPGVDCVAFNDDGSATILIVVINDSTAIVDDPDINFTDPQYVQPPTRFFPGYNSWRATIQPANNGDPWGFIWSLGHASTTLDLDLRDPTGTSTPNTMPWYTCAEKGQIGPQGPQGEQGTQGPQGERGPAGPKGDTGAQGATGASGPAGESGPSGLSNPTTVQSAPVVVRPKRTATAVARCAAGAVPVSGGYTISKASRPPVVLASAPTAQGWQIRLRNPSHRSLQLTASAVCAGLTPPAA